MSTPDDVAKQAIGQAADKTLADLTAERGTLRTERDALTADEWLVEELKKQGK